MGKHDISLYLPLNFYHKYEECADCTVYFHLRDTELTVKYRENDL